MNRALHNHKNLGMSLAQKHQDLQLYHLTSKNYFTKNEFGSIENVDPNKRNTIKTKLSWSNCEFFKWARINNIEYHVGDMICYENNSNLPQFGKIEHLIVQENILVFYLQIYQTLSFVNCFMAYAVREKKKSFL